VDGHDLQVGARRGVRAGEEAAQLGVQIRHVGPLRALVEAVQDGEIGQGILQIPGLSQAGRSAQGHPGSLHPAPQGLAAT